MKTMTTLTGLIVGTLMASAALEASTVRYDLDRSAKFASFRSVSWESAGAGIEDPISDQRIRRALAAELEAKGYRMAEAGKGDLVLDYLAVVRRKRTIEESPGPRWGRDLRLRTSPEGTLAVELVERATGKTVWHGAVTDALASDPEKADRKTEKAVAKLLAKLPDAGGR